MRCASFVVVVMLTACGSGPPSDAERPLPPYPEAAPDDVAPELGWRHGGCAWDLAGASFGDLPLDAAIGPVKEATLACRVSALIPERASVPNTFNTDRDDAPDLVVGASFGAGPKMTRRAPDDDAEGWVAFAPVTLASGDAVAFAAEDVDPLSDNDSLGYVRGDFAVDRPLVLTSDSLRVACVVVPPGRLQRTLEPLQGELDAQLAEYAAGQPDPLTPFERPEAAARARDTIRCMAALAGPGELVQRSLPRLTAGDERWTALGDALVDDLRKGAVRAAALADTPLGFSLGAPVCGEAKLPDDPSWGMSSRADARDGATWCRVPFTLVNRGRAPIHAALVTSPTRPEYADTLGVLGWSGITGRSLGTCVRQGRDVTLAPGESLAAEAACSVGAGDRLKFVRLQYRFGPAVERTAVFIVDAL